MTKNLLFVLFLVLTYTCSAQQPTQNVRGQVMDSETRFKNIEIYKKLDAGMANYKRKNAAALHLFIKAVIEYQKFIEDNPDNNRIAAKLQKANMLRYGCMKMSTM